MRGIARVLIPIKIRPVLWLLICAASALIKSAPVAAQGTFGTVADPITSRELEDYADRLGLSELQLQAALAAHDEYRDAFRVLRDGDIEKFVQESQGFRGGPAMMSMNRKDVEKALRTLDSVMNKIAALDNRLFDQIQGVLTEEQMAQMPRVRQTRERVRDQSGLSRMVGFLNPASRVDLSAMLMDMDLTAAERQNADPILISYEANLTTAAKRLHDGASDMVLEILDRLAKAGFDDQAMQDPQKRGQMFEAFRTVWGEVSVKVQDKASTIATLNRHTLRDVTPMLSDDHASRLRTNFVQRAYSEAYGGQNNAARAFRAALRFDNLTAEQKSAITAQQTEFRDGYDHLTDQMMDVIDDTRKNSNFMDFGSDRRRRSDEKLDALREKRTAMVTSTFDSLKATLGPELSAKLDRKVVEGKEENADNVRTFNITGMGGAVTAVQVNGVNKTVDGIELTVISDPYVPGAISERNLNQYADVLAITGDRRSVLDSLHEEYREKFDALEQTDIKAVRDASQRLWLSPGGGGGGGNGGQQVVPPTAEAIDQLYSLRRQALASILALDSSFFDDVQSALLKAEETDKLQRVRLMRQRDVYNRGDNGGSFNFGGRNGGRRGGDNGPRGGGPGGGGPGGRRGFNFFGGSSEESTIDLAFMVDKLTLQGDDRAKADTVLVEYERSIADDFKKRYETSMKTQQALDKVNAQNTADNQRRGGGGGPGGGGPGGGGPGGGRGEAYRQVMDNEGKASRQAASDITALNKSTLSQLLNVLPTVAADNLRMSYNRKAFPNVYRDSRSAEPHLTAALTLDDLNPQQRSAISDMTAEYKAAYDQLCDQLVKLSANQPDFSAGFSGGGGPGGGGPGGQNRDWQAMQDQQRAADKIAFDRDDLSDKALAKLRAVLNDDQSKRLGITRDDKAQ